MTVPRILVVDDDTAIRLLVARLFKRKGFEVTTANDGEEALARLAESSFDLVILDLMMPRMDGVGVSERIAALPEPRPRIIIMTAAVPNIVERLPSESIWKVVSKPFNLGNLLEEGMAALADGQRAVTEAR